MTRIHGLELRIYFLVVTTAVVCTLLLISQTRTNLLHQDITAIDSVSYKLAPTSKSRENVTGYVQFNGDRSFTKRCVSCALVSSSGTILNTGAGQHIDNNHCVIRMNNAPSTGFEKDVGTKTSIRVFSHTSVLDITALVNKERDEAKATTFVVWGPERNMKPGGITNKYLVSLVSKYPSIEIFMFKHDHMKKADQIFEKETGRNRISSGTFLSTGWFTMLFAKEICESINVYGMVEDNFCDKIQREHKPDVIYHYYEKDRWQCKEYYGHENARAGAHRFLTEKRVFKKWAREWGNVQFHYPEWNINEG